MSIVDLIAFFASALILARQYGCTLNVETSTNLYRKIRNMSVISNTANPLNILRPTERPKYRWETERYSVFFVFSALFFSLHVIAFIFNEGDVSSKLPPCKAEEIINFKGHFIQGFFCVPRVSQPAAFKCWLVCFFIPNTREESERIHTSNVSFDGQIYGFVLFTMGTCHGVAMCLAKNHIIVSE